MIWDLLLVASGIWLCYRAYLIYLIPREELEEKLGWDIPPVPEVSVAGIKTNSVLLYWLNSQDSQSAIIEHSIEVNGIKVGKFGRGQTSIEITGLKPGDCYNIRVIALNSASVISSGPFIRVQTPQTHDADLEAASIDGPHVVAVGELEAAAIRTTSPPFEPSVSPPLSKDVSETPRCTDRNGLITRSGNVDNPVHILAPFVNGPGDESIENIQHLIDALEYLKRQKEEVDRQIEEDEVEAKMTYAELVKERERVRQALKEREDIGVELRKQGNNLDKTNRSAQSKKAAKEKQLCQKISERQRLEDDNMRWDREVLNMRQETEEMKAELAQVNETKKDDLSEIKEAIIEDVNANRSLEEEIRVKAAELKSLEERKDQLGVDGVEEQQRVQKSKERDEVWEMNVQRLQGQLGSMWQALHQDKLEIQQSEETLRWWVDKRAGNPEQFAPIPALDFPPYIHRNSSRKGHQVHSRHSTVSSPSYQTVSLAHGAPVTSPPCLKTISLFNSTRDGAISLEPDEVESSQSEAETLIGGSLTKQAVKLLPSDLLGDEDFAGPQSKGMGCPESATRSRNDISFKHTLSETGASLPAPLTPLSPDSRAGSTLSSHHNSVSILQRFQPAQDAFVDNNDRHSATSGSVPFYGSLTTDSNSPASSRLANLFSAPFSRQRGKINTQDAPMLGTLKQGQSQSFPRKFELDTMDFSGNRRRRGSHGNWVNPMTTLLARNSPGAREHGFITTQTSSGRNSRLNMFKPKFDGLESLIKPDQAASRPSSTYSHEQLCDRPSSESQRPWWPISETIPSRNSPLGANWTANHGPWSHLPSRRASLQYGSATNLSIGSTPLEPEEMTGSLLKQRSEQAPIGTRPKSSQRPPTPRLNPAAPSFKTLFRGKLDRSAGKASEKSKDKDVPERPEANNGPEITYEASPPSSRLSRDAQSINTATSMADSHDSFEGSPSETPSDIVPSGQKESLMQKISRKSSSSKFNVPWSKDRGIFSKKVGEPSTPGEIEEDTAIEWQLDPNVESTGSIPQQERTGRANISWSNIRRKSKKGMESNEGVDGNA